jgi:hypothetical protein
MYICQGIVALWKQNISFGLPLNQSHVGKEVNEGSRLLWLLAPLNQRFSPTTSMLNFVCNCWMTVTVHIHTSTQEIIGP